jgi:16S rRNA (guanine527-N7)-methyltransferase
LLIKKWNKTRNLVSRKLTDHDLENHIIDCIALNEVISENNILDVGTGAGLPGVVIALLNPTKKVKLLDSNSKKISFLNHVKTKLTMKNVTIEHNRLEKCDLSQEKLIVCRAFTSPVELINIVRKKLPKKSTILMMISKDQETSIQGFKTEYIPSSAEDILEKKRGFLRITI